MYAKNHVLLLQWEVTETRVRARVREFKTEQQSLPFSVSILCNCSFNLFTVPPPLCHPVFHTFPVCNMLCHVGFPFLTAVLFPSFDCFIIPACLVSLPPSSSSLATHPISLNASVLYGLPTVLAFAPCMYCIITIVYYC